MRVCMVTPHLPPMQAAVALLPVTLGETLASSDVIASYVSHPHEETVPHREHVTLVPRRGRGTFQRSKAGAGYAAARMAAGLRGPVASSDLVHLHSNGLIVEVGAWLATRLGKPYVVTLYGTDVSEHDPIRNARYGNVVRGASARVFYSKGLRDRGASLGLAPPPSTTIYAPVASEFHAVTDLERAVLRRDLGVGDAPVFLTVKHLRPVGGHDVLLKAVPEILREHPHATFWLIGDGDRRPSLEQMARDLGVAQSIRFLGRIGNKDVWKYYAAADAFILSSHTESWGTVMLEALACGTPVVTTDTVGGIEVRDNFPDDVTVVPKGDHAAFARAASAAVTRRMRATSQTLEKIRREFSVAACASHYLAVYRGALGVR